MIDEPHFRWTCSYQGSVWYTVDDATGRYGLELRRRADDYERKCYNGDDADWQRNIVAMIGVLRREHDIAKPIPDATFHSFNAWLIAEHAKHMAHLRAHPERYGTDFSDIQKPTLAHAAARYDGGWHITARA
jgi:hypothetical protein